MLIWPVLAYTIFPPSSVPFWLLGVGLAVDAAFLLPMRPYLRAVVGAVVVTAAGYGALLLQTVAERTPVALSTLSIEEMRDTYDAGSALTAPPVDWGSAWWACLLLIGVWAGVVLFASRTVGLTTPRPVPLGVSYAPEPNRDENGVLAGFAEPVQK
jgi:hypothetical protein